MRVHLIVVISILVCGAICFGNEEVDFNRDVKPILADRCYACHGPDAESRKGKLRLDRRADAVKKKAIIPGNPTGSALIERIFETDLDERMPPKDFHKPLTDHQKQTLKKWIAAGAKYADHWAFVPARSSALPKVADASWAKNPIDRFVLAHLERKHATPSSPASRETLIRRVTLDLIGLPPTPEEIDAFLADKKPDAYERLVDRLMATTAYAERRAQDWLDLARFADTRGFADDKQRNIWPYRDWVIGAMHRNMPFNQFTIEQVAGDMLPGATDEQRLASAFHRNAPQAKGQTYPEEEYRLKGVVERVNTTGRVWLGLTMECAECHDHKFDPITQRDYYAMFAYFNNIEHTGKAHAAGGPKMNYRLPAVGQNDASSAERKRLQAELAKALKAQPSRGPIQDKSLLGQWGGPAVAADAAKYAITGDLTITATIQTTQGVVNIASTYDVRGGQRAYVFGIGGEGDNGAPPGHLFFWVSSQAGKFSGITVYGSRRVNDGKPHDVAVAFEAGKSVRLFVDGVEDKSAKASGQVPGSIAKSNRPLAIGEGYSGSPKPNAYRFKGGLKEVRLYGRPLGDRLGLGAPGGEVARLSAALAKLEIKTGKTISAVPVMRELAKPRPTFIHNRGNFLDRGAQVKPAVPKFLAVSNGRQPNDRLAFAQWLVDGKNPLVARVAVNRFWQGYFGHGLVRTPRDFGVQGGVPSHPQLLDWLASAFVNSGWDMKKVHRLIVTSATYRQSTRIERTMAERDPANRWLGRMPRVRLPAEQIRDQALAISGLLEHQVGGPPVFPEHPAGYWQQRALPGKWTKGKDDQLHRRTMYTYWRRMALHPSLELLNAPARENCVARRDISNLPTQALVLLNDPIFTEAAEAFAAPLLRDEKASDAKRIVLAFRLAMGRLPSDQERSKFFGFIGRERRTTSQQIAWARACGVLLNLDEVITRP